jgi:hypothetical protein
MRDSSYTLTVNLPNNHLLNAIFPISRGVYAGHDLLLLMDDLCGSYYVVRATTDGKTLSTSPKVFGIRAGMEIVEKLIRDQSTKECNEVTGNGRWGCE